MYNKYFEINMLKKDILSDLKIAMKAKDVKTRDTLRTLDSMIKNEEIKVNKREEGINDSEIVAIIKRAIKQRKDSIKQFIDGGRLELAEIEKEEIAVLEKYMPTQMSEEDIEKVIKKVLTDNEFSQKSDIGKAMGVIMKKVGDNADGTIVRKILSKLLV